MAKRRRAEHEREASGFVCPECGGQYFGADAATGIVTCHGDGSNKPYRKCWRGRYDWRKKEELIPIGIKRLEHWLIAFLDRDQAPIGADSCRAVLAEFQALDALADVAQRILLDDGNEIDGLLIELEAAVASLKKARRLLNA